MDKIIRFGTCTKDCYGACVFNGFWNDNAPERKLLKAEPRKDHPFTNGFFCPKYSKRQDLLYHPERLKNPLYRNGVKPSNKFMRISSQKALNIIAEKVKNLKRNGESKKILGAFYAGNSGLISMYSPLRFFTKLGAKITTGGICNEGGCAGLKKLFGTYSITNPFQILDPNTRLIVIWGSNLSESNNHAYYLVKKAMRNGVVLSVVDSRLSYIAKKSHNFLHILPGTEHLLVKLVIKAIIKHNAHDSGFLRNNVDSYSSILTEISNIDENHILSNIGITNDEFQEFVNLLIKFKHHSIFMIGYGIQKHVHGGRIVENIALLQILLGNIGKSGTGIIYSQSDFLRPTIQPLLDYISYCNGTSNSFLEVPLIELGSEIILRDIKLLFIYNFNPASSLPNQNKLRKVLSNEELFVIVLDLFLNETTKYADIVIPAKFDLEISDIISPYYIPSLSINIGGPCPYPDCMSNYSFFQQIYLRTGFEDSKIFKETEKKLFEKCLSILPKRICKDLNSQGYYLFHNQKSVPYKNLKFPTTNNKIQAQGPHFKFGESEFGRIITRKENEFILISPSHYHLLHSQLGQLNLKYLADFGKVFLNKEDITQLKLNSGDNVLVSNDYGSAIYILSELRSLKKGTALIFSGASSPSNENVNVNIFTPDTPEELGLSGAYNSVKICIEKI
ncbi:MAG: molybdopterin-dependent oxidoreductase [Candidatus Thorarchaeota archaeon]